MKIIPDSHKRFSSEQVVAEFHLEFENFFTFHLCKNRFCVNLCSYKMYVEVFLILCIELLERLMRLFEENYQRLLSILFFNLGSQMIHCY